jgi:hypothetical protein
MFANCRNGISLSGGEGNGQSVSTGLAQECREQTTFTSKRNAIDLQGRHDTTTSAIESSCVQVAGGVLGLRRSPFISTWAKEKIHEPGQRDGNQKNLYGPRPVTLGPSSKHACPALGPGGESSNFDSKHAQLSTTKQMKHGSARSETQPIGCRRLSIPPIGPPTEPNQSGLCTFPLRRNNELAIERDHARFYLTLTSLSHTERYNTRRTPEQRLGGGAAQTERPVTL